MIVLLGPTLVRSADLRLSTQGSVEYDSNIRRSPTNAESDAVWRFSQKMRLSQTESGYDYYVEYRLPYQVSTRTATLRDLNHFVAVGGRYQLGPKTSLSMRNNFTFVNSSSRLQFEDDAGVLQIDRRDELITRISGGLTLGHVFTKRVQGSLNFPYSYFDSTDDNRRPVSTVGGVGSLSYAVDSKNRVGFGANVTRQAFDDLPGSPGSETITYRGFLSWIVRFDETLSLSLRGGPTLLSTRQNSPSAGRSETFTFFGTALLTKRWTPRVRTSINYRRTQSDASGLGGTTILDAVGASLSWRLSQLWSSSLRFDWTQRESVAGLDPNPISTRRWAIGARLVRTLSPRLKATLRLSFNRQLSRRRSAGRSTDFDTFGAILGFSYLFDPIAVW